MKKLLLGAAAVAAMTATPAFATDTVATYGVSGSVNAYCSAAPSGSIILGNLSDSSAQLNVFSGAATADSTAFCNGAGTQLTIANTNLVSDSAQQSSPPSGFTGTITYTPTVTLQGHLYSGVQSGTSVGAFSGLQVALTGMSAGGAKLLAGGYSSTITVTLSPNP